MATEPETEELLEDVTDTVETEPTPVAITYYTNDLLACVRYDVETIATFVREIQWWLKLLMYSILGACVGWAIGSLLV